MRRLVMVGKLLLCFGGGFGPAVHMDQGYRSPIGQVVNINNWVSIWTIAES